MVGTTCCNINYRDIKNTALQPPEDPGTDLMHSMEIPPGNNSRRECAFNKDRDIQLSVRSMVTGTPAALKEHRYNWI